MRASRNYRVSLEGIWNGAGTTGARAFFIHLGGRFDTVEAELSLPGLMFLVHQQTTHLPWMVRRGKLHDSNRFSKTPDRCFYIPRHPCKTTLFASHFQKSDKKRSAHVHLTWSPRRPPVKPRLSRVPWLGTRRAPSTGASYNTGAFLAALSVGSSAGCTRRTVLALLSWCRRPGRWCFCFRQVGTDISVL